MRHWEAVCRRAARFRTRGTASDTTCFGAAVAHGCDQELGDIRFRAWKHGPVNLDVYRLHHQCGRAVLPKPGFHEVPVYSEPLQQVLRDVLAVYGRLSPWQIREESHEEAPWLRTRQSDQIDPADVRTHFREKFAPGRVSAPKHLIQSWSFRVDGLPVHPWPSLHSLASALRA